MEIPIKVVEHWVNNFMNDVIEDYGSDSDYEYVPQGISFRANVDTVLDELILFLGLSNNNKLIEKLREREEEQINLLGDLLLKNKPNLENIQSILEDFAECFLSYDSEISQLDDPECPEDTAQLQEPEVSEELADTEDAFSDDTIVRADSD